MATHSNNVRDELQARAARLLHTDKRLIAKWATGVGKSSIVIKYLQEHPDTSTLIVVPEVNNIDNWKEEFRKFGVDAAPEIICYASLKNYRDTYWGLVVFDECPHVDTDLRADIIHSISAERVVALGAVVSEDEEAVLTSVYGRFVQSRVTLDMAISMGILPPPEIRVIHLELDDTEKKYRYGGRQLTAKETYRAIEAKVNNAVVAYNNASNVWNQRKMQQAGAERKRFLGEQKSLAIAYICNRLQASGKRFLCFCSSINQAEHLGGDRAFTSKTPASMKVLERFNNHEIDSIYVVGKLIEGQNLRDIDCGVIGQLGGKERITTQSIGRVMRSSHPTIYVPVFDNTKDDGFMHSLTSSISEKYIKHFKL